MKRIIHTNNAAAAIGPYSQAVMHGNTLYVSGQIALDPKTGTLVMDSIEAECHQVLKNMHAVLQAADMDWEHVLKCSIFLSSMELFPAVNDVYSQYFKASVPARECVAVQTLPKSVNVEISCIAAK